MRFFILLIIIIFPFWAIALEVPYLSGRVNDYAKILSEGTRQLLEERLKDHEDRTTNQIAVLTISSLEGDDLEDFAERVFQTWQLGQAGKDNGVLLLIVSQDRKLRIEVGYGLEPYLTDAQGSRIIRDRIVPYFKGGDYEKGIEEGVNAILGQIEGIEELSTTDETSSPSDGGGYGFLTFVLGIISLVAGSFILKKRRRNAPRKSKETGLPMRKLSEEKDDEHLSSGQRVEEQIGSVGL